MKKLPILVAVLSSVFFAQRSYAGEASDKWQQFCEGASAENMAALNGRMKQLGEEGWELMSAGTGMACYKRPWRKGADPLAAVVLPKVAPAKSAPIAKALVTKPVAKPAEAEVEPSPAIAAAASEVMAAPSVTQAPAAKPSQAQAEPAAPSRSLLSESPDQNEAPHARRALVPKS